MFPCNPFKNVNWRKIEGLDHCFEQVSFSGETILKVKHEAMECLAEQAFHDISHFLRPGHLEQLRKILDDPDASSNDRFVALDLLRNSQIAAEGILPMCQDTGTAIILAKKGRGVWTSGADEDALSRGIEKTYATDNLRFSQLAPLAMFEEKNTRSNLPAQIDILHTDGQEYHFLFMAKGGDPLIRPFCIKALHPY